MSDEIEPIFARLGEHLTELERLISSMILTELSKLTKNSPNPDSVACDAIFAMYTERYLKRCVSQGLTSRAAWFSREHLIPAVFKLEQKSSARVHKGALFYDVGVAHLLSGNEDGYERFNAMADEEDVLKTQGAHKRGTTNLRSDGLGRQTMFGRLQLASDLVNGKIASSPANFAFLTDRPPINAAQFDKWREGLGELDQFELLRMIHDAEVFLGIGYPDYPAANDNPFVLLRLAKVLAHLAQWVENCLTCWQGGGGGALSNKLKNDAHFGAPLSACAGNPELFAGHCPHGAAVDLELLGLLTHLETAPVGSERHWRALRILYIVRNSTAHAIEPGQAIYHNLPLLLNLLQVVFASVFVICQLKARPMP